MYIKYMKQMVQKRQIQWYGTAWCETETQAAGEAWPTSFTHHSLQLEVIPTIYLNSLLNYIAIR